MAKFRLKKGTKGVYEFKCPGCNYIHVVHTISEGLSPIIWHFDKNIDEPTIEPSLLLVGDYPDGKHICHSFIRNGFISFLPDCTHSLKGRIVQLPQIECDHDPVGGGGMVTCAKCGDILSPW